MVEVCTLPSAF